MKNLIRLEDINGLSFVSSKTVAEKFDREHFHVLRDVKELLEKCSKEFGTSNFGCNKITRLDGSEETSEYLMTKDGFMMLTMKFQTRESYYWKEQFIHAFNELEKTTVELMDKNKALLEENQRLVQKLLPKSKSEKVINVPQFERDIFGDMQITRYHREPQKQLSSATLLESQVLHLSKLMQGMARKINELQAQQAINRRN